MPANSSANWKRRLSLNLETTPEVLHFPERDAAGLLADADRRRQPRFLDVEHVHLARRGAHAFARHERVAGIRRHRDTVPERGGRLQPREALAARKVEDLDETALLECR